MVFTLIGFMGCGKSSVGRDLAARLGWDFADSDLLVQTREGMGIPEIFALKGEEGFRSAEYSCISETVAEYCREGMPHLVFSLGGGAPTYKPTADLISSKTSVIYFRCPAEELIENLKEDGTENRPMLQGYDLEERVRQLLSRREPLYAGCASMTIHPYSLTPQMLEGLAGRPLR